jgi:hypothetical protein
MSWKQYGYAVLLGSGIGVGIIIGSRIGDSSLGWAHVIVGCILTALMTVKTLSVSLKAAAPPA